MFFCLRISIINVDFGDKTLKFAKKSLKTGGKSLRLILQNRGVHLTLKCFMISTLLIKFCFGLRISIISFAFGAKTLN
jgi:hypothetical protein